MEMIDIAAMPLAQKNGEGRQLPNLLSVKLYLAGKKRRSVCSKGKGRVGYRQSEPFIEKAVDINAVLTALGISIARKGDKITKWIGEAPDLARLNCTDSQSLA